MYLLTETVSPFALERWAAFFANFGQFAKGFLYTLGISIGALIVALLLGLIFGAMSSTRNKVLRGISRVYVEIFQNTPLLVQFVVVFYGISILTDGNVMIRQHNDQFRCHLFFLLFQEHALPRNNACFHSNLPVNQVFSY